jgi:hypothetical protein
MPTIFDLTKKNTKLKPANHPPIDFQLLGAVLRKKRPSRKGSCSMGAALLRCEGLAIVSNCRRHMFLESVSEAGISGHSQIKRIIALIVRPREAAWEINLYKLQSKDALMRAAHFCDRFS